MFSTGTGLVFTTSLWGSVTCFVFVCFTSDTLPTGYLRVSPDHLGIWGLLLHSVSLPSPSCLGHASKWVDLPAHVSNSSSYRKSWDRPLLTCVMCVPRRTHTTACYHRSPSPTWVLPLPPAHPDPPFLIFVFLGVCTSITLLGWDLRSWLPPSWFLRERGLGPFPCLDPTYTQMALMSVASPG